MGRFAECAARAVGLAVVAVALAAATAGATGQTLRIVGSGNVSRILETARPAFEAAHPGIALEIESRPSASGPPALLRGEADIASLSRPMSAVEREAFVKRTGGEPVATEIGIDAVAVYVNEDNPLDQITLGQIEAVFARTAECEETAPIERWEALGVEGALSEREIGLYGHGPSSGTTAFFRSRALCGAPLKERLRAQPGGRSVVVSIAENERAIGYSARAFRDERGVRALAVAEDEDGPFATIEAEDVYAGRYPLIRRLYLYRVAAEPGEETDSIRAMDALLAFMLSDAGQAAVAEAGFLPLAPPSP